MSPISIEAFVRGLPKAELHVHIEGTLEPELMFELALRNGVALPYGSVDEVRDAYTFDNLQSFLDIYYRGAAVLVQEQDFYELAIAYLKRAASQNVRHAEIFFDPQMHTERGIAFETILRGLRRALDEAERTWGLTSELILCFLRHLSPDSAMATLEQALPYRGQIIAVGLDSAEAGNPPSKFEEVFNRALIEGFLTVAHAGEEGPPSFIWEALDLLRVARIDHGVRCLEDPKLVERLRDYRVPLTVCPLSNVKLHVFERLEDHNLKKLLDERLCVCLNSDDPAYFGGYIDENFTAAQRALGLGFSDLHSLARNSFEASFLTSDAQAKLIAEVDDYIATSSASTPG